MTTKDLEWIEWARLYSPREYQRHLRFEMQKIILRYLDNHCANSDAEGMSALCECQLCNDARETLRTT